MTISLVTTCSFIYEFYQTLKEEITNSTQILEMWREGMIIALLKSKIKQMTRKITRLASLMNTDAKN